MRNRMIVIGAQELNHWGVRFTVDSVAEQAGISKKTFYQHFSSKKDFIGAIIRDVMRDLDLQAAAIIASDADVTVKLFRLLMMQPRHVKKLNERVFADIQRHFPDEWNQITQHRKNRVVQLEQLLAEGVAVGQFRPVHPSVAIQMMYSILDAFLNSPFLVEHRLSLEQALRYSNDILLNGIVTGRLSMDGEPGPDNEKLQEGEAHVT